MLKAVLTSALLGILGGSGAAAQASFDCAKAGTSVEHAICASAELSRLDRALAEAYAGARQGAGTAQRDAIRADQRRWLARRDRCGGQPDCLANLMDRRIATLRGIDGSVPHGLDLTGFYCPDDASAMAVQQRGSALVFNFAYFGANGHSCATPDMTGRRTGDGWTARQDGCELTLRQVGAEIVVNTETFDACRQYCGARTAINEFRVPLSSRNAGIADPIARNWMEEGC